MEIMPNGRNAALNLEKPLRMKIVENDSFSQKFSKCLETRLITYFKKTYDLEVSSDEAELFLESLAKVYDALSKRSKDDNSRLESQPTC